MDETTPATVEITIPGTPDFVRLARLVASDAATRAGLTIDAIEDLRLAVSELVTMLTGGAPMRLIVRIEPGAVDISGRGTLAEGSADAREISEALVHAVTDGYELRLSGSFRVWKGRASR